MLCKCLKTSKLFRGDMAIVVHKIAGNYYAYEHYRDGKEVKCEYLYPVNSDKKLELILVNEFKDKNGQTWLGMNYYAAKELKISFPYSENSIVIAKTSKAEGITKIERKKRNEIIRHEVVEREQMKKGIKYKEAHKLGLKLE